MTQHITLRLARAEEFKSIGNLLVEVYANLEGFPKPHEQPAYYAMLENVGELTKKPETEILVAEKVSELLGAVVYFNDMQYYGSGGSATREKNSAGFRLLGVKESARGLGVGKELTLACISKARERKRKQIIIHTTAAMQRAWKMYEQIGFLRSEDLDFMQGHLQVLGFRMDLSK